MTRSPSERATQLANEVVGSCADLSQSSVSVSQRVDRYGAACKALLDYVAQLEAVRDALREIEVFIVADKYAARENVLAMVRAALSEKGGT